jgi:hypothetical protein
MLKRMVVVLVGLALAGSAQGALMGVLIQSHPSTGASGRTTWVCVYDTSGRRVTVLQDYPCEGTRRLQ